MVNFSAPSMMSVSTKSRRYKNYNKENDMLMIQL